MRRTALVLVLLVAATAAWADVFDDAAEAGRRRDFTTALRLLQPVAEGGDLRAQLAVARIYDGGYWPRRYREAVKWYRLAAEQGDAGSQYQLGYMYLRRMGVRFDPAAAARWFLRAAEQGHWRAQIELSRMYDEGWGVPRDRPKAYMWLRIGMTYGNYTGRGGGRWRSTQGQSELRIIARSMTAAQVAEAERLATVWRPRPER
jgi:hypothetical protein